MDSDGSGTIDISELTAIMKNRNIDMSSTEFQKLIEEMDYQNNGKINYSEFLSATIDTRRILNDKRLLVVFNQFDTDKSNKITEENIYLALQKMGLEVQKDEISKMIKEHDLNKDGVLSFDEFKKIFVNLELESS